MKRICIAVLSVVITICASCNYITKESTAQSGLSTDLYSQEQDDTYYDIGEFHYKVSTKSKLAQTWFDRGLALCHAFNHEEAVHCFERALQEDPSMPMALWGIAYAWGPNINNLEIEPHQIARAAQCLHLAKLNAKNSSLIEKDLISTLSLRYSTPVPKDRSLLNKTYAEGMRKLHKKYPDNVLITALFAESLMNLRPWNHWTPDGIPAEETPEIIAVLEGGLKRYPSDPALCHFYIHVMEASPTPEKALPAANALRNVMPGAGHLLHMPSHIDVLVGDYDAANKANQRAIEADKEFLKREGAYNFYTLYRIHNYHFLVYGAMFDGQSELALKTAREIPKQVPEDFLKEWSDYLDAFMPIPMHVLVRFGRWNEILEEPKPAEYLPMSQTTWHYARALAYATKGQVKEAEKEQEAFLKALTKVPKTSILFNNTSHDILGVAEKMMAGEIAYRKGDYEFAFKQLRKAVELDDALNYDEPWGWMQPARHALGALLMEQGQLAEAESVYRNDLKRHPKNIWALHGLAESLEKQGKKAEAKKYHTQFKLASSRADVEIDRSCYCRIIGLEESK
jgi:tetratricopeptide (TPR) repeat protein